MVANIYLPYTNDKYQEIIIDGLIKFYNQGLNISINFLKKTSLHIPPTRIMQFIFMVVLQLAFGLTIAGIFPLLVSGKAEKARGYISNLNTPLLGKITASKRMRQVIEPYKCELLDLAEHFQNHLFTGIKLREVDRIFLLI